MATVMEKVQTQFDALVEKARGDERTAAFVEKIEAMLAEGGSLYELRKKIEAFFEKSEEKAALKDADDAAPEESE